MIDFVEIIVKQSLWLISEDIGGARRILEIEMELLCAKLSGMATVTMMAFSEWGVMPASEGLKGVQGYIDVVS
jgi:hypothetical protein